MPIVFIDISISCHDRLVSVYKHSIYETEEVSFIFRTIIIWTTKLRITMNK